MKRFYQYAVLLALALPLLLAVGCKREEDPYEPPPSDSAPSIRRTQPQQPSALLLPNDGISLRYVMTDNQELATFKVYETRYVNVVYGENGTFTGDKVPGYDQREIEVRALSGNESTQDFLYAVDPTIDVFTRIELWAEVADNKGQKEKVGPFVITVDFTRLDPLAEYFSILSYSGDRIYNNQSVSRASGFNLVARRVTNPDNYANVAAKDIQESTPSPNSFVKKLISPNNGSAPVLVVLKPSQFNYDNLTYATMKNAFLSNVPVAETAELQAGDIVIVKMNLVHQTYSGDLKNHFAAIRIVEIKDNGNVDDDDYITFDYKRSQDVIQ